MRRSPRQKYLIGIPAYPAKAAQDFADDGHREVVDLIGGFNPGQMDGVPERRHPIIGDEGSDSASIVQSQMAYKTVERGAYVGGGLEHESRDPEGGWGRPLSQQQSEVPASRRRYAASQ